MSKETEAGGAEPMQALVVGAGGGIGGALVEHWARDARFDRVWAISREPAPVGSGRAQVSALATDHAKAEIHQILAQISAESPRLARVAIALGTLHGPDLQPEKSLDALEAEAMAELYRVNCVLPLLWVAGLGRVLRRSPDCRVGVLSARVGSIGDNRLGGWYSYRCAKAALNMGLKSAAVELGRRARGMKLVAYHPGTVDTPLSQPFQKNVPEGRLFTPAFTAGRLSMILDEQGPDGELSYVDYDGRSIPW